MSSYPEIIFEDFELVLISPPNETMLKETGSDASIIKTEMFNLDMAYHLVRCKELDKESKSRIQKMIKNKVKNNQLDVTYKLGKNIKEGLTGRWIANRSMGLQGLNHDVRGALAQEYYWDVDIVNCQVVLLRELAIKYSWKYDMLEYYINNRENLFKEMITEKNNDISRDDLKQRFIALLFGGYTKPSDPKWIVESFYPEISEMMTKLAKEFPETFKRCKKSKPDNPIGSCCAHVLQTEERRCLMSLDHFLLTQNRSMDVLIHDGGYVRKLTNEKEFPSHLLSEASVFIKRETGYNVKLSQKIISTTITIPSIEVKTGRSYSEIKEQFEKHNFKCLDDSRFYNYEQGHLVSRSKEKFKIAFEHLYYDEVIDNSVVSQQFLGGKLQRWFIDPEIRCYQSVKMLPPPLLCPVNTYNSWSGFLVEHLSFTNEDLDSTELGEKFNSILHLIMLLCNNDSLTYEYVLNWYASIFQSPGQKNLISILFKSIPGLGKNTLYRLLLDMMGSTYCGYSDNPERDVFGNFNSVLSNKIYFVFDEMSASIGFKYSDRLKGLITGDNHEINRKGVEVESQKSFTRFNFFTNNQFPIKVDDDDRRYLSIASECPPESKEFYDNFEKNIISDQRIHYKFYQFLMNRDISKVNWIKDRPETEMSKDLKSISRSKELHFIIQFFQDNIGSSDIIITLPNLWQQFLDHLKSQSSSVQTYMTTELKFGIFIKNLKIKDFSNNQKKTGKKVVREYCFPYESVNAWLTSKTYVSSSTELTKFKSSKKSSK